VPEAFLRKILGVNLMSLWFTTQEFLPRMIQLDKGHVITIASVASFVALTSAADYSATKAGALAFHEALASELKHCYKSPNVLTTVVHPNFVDTPLLRDVNARLDRAGVRLLTPEHISREVVAQIKSRRGGQLIIPSSTSVVSGIRGWPTWVQELLRDGVGRGSVMK
jgi:all-trans-retinol dehydrogenase (NAD+)